MALPSPNLDDRDFDQLLEESKRVISQSCPAWTDLSPGDPGIVLLEVFAHLTETMIYRLNRVPDKAYIEFLRLIGLRLQPPSAASVKLVFSLSGPAEHPVEIPRGTRVTVARSGGGAEPVVFATARPATIVAASTEATVLAHHCDLVQGELAGEGTGFPGLSLTASRPPIVAPTGEELDLVVGVEALPSELDVRAPALAYQSKAYRIWREVENFSDLGPDRFVYVADRMTGQITFAPAAQMKDEKAYLDESPQALAEVPVAGREIRLWYRRGGGPTGNVAANTLKTLKDPIPGVQVTNPEPAAGGRAAETLENALIRGPQELHSLRRAVTARDFETLAMHSSGAVARAKAFTKSMLWVHAAPGTVEVLLVPDVPEQERAGGKVSAAQLQERHTEEARSQIQQALDERRPLGTNCLVNWGRYKTVRVQARVVAGEEEDVAAVREKVLERLHGVINPLPTKLKPSGWRFGQALRVSNVYDVALSEPGVSYVDRVQLIVDEVPESDVRSIRSDAFQPRTWYSGSGTTLFRSVDDGDGWEAVGRFSGELIQSIAVHPGKSGLIAAATQLPGEKGGSGLYVSWDCGETWETKATTAFSVEDTAWMLRGGVPVLLLATDAGLYELSMQAGATPVQVFVYAGDQEHGFYAVAASTDIRGGVLSVAVAAQALGGVFLSSEGGKANTFRDIGLKGEDVRVLAVQQEGLRAFLWAGLAAPSAGDPGTGCHSWELLGSQNPPEGWLLFNKKWTGGSCKALAFQGSTVLAGSHHAGLLRLPARRDDAEWEIPELGCGLPLREADQLFQPVDAVAADPQGRQVLAGGRLGIYRSQGPGDKDKKVSYENCSNKVFLDKVTLPPTWLFCSGEHDISVVTEDEAERD
jgi:hypothetical protein